MSKLVASSQSGLKFINIGLKKNHLGLKAISYSIPLFSMDYIYLLSVSELYLLELKQWYYLYEIALLKL